MAASTIQPIGFMLSALGQFLISAATAMDTWSSQDRSFTFVTNVYTYLGLWNSCVGTAYGTTQALFYHTGTASTAPSCPGLDECRYCFQSHWLHIRQATMTLIAGILFLLAGVRGIAGVSALANLIVQSFRFTTYADGGFGLLGGGGVAGLTGTLTPRYTFGPALFVGWIGGAILAVD